MSLTDIVSCDTGSLVVPFTALLGVGEALHANRYGYVPRVQLWKTAFPSAHFGLCSLRRHIRHRHTRRDTANFTMESGPRVMCQPDKTLAELCTKLEEMVPDCLGVTLMQSRLALRRNKVPRFQHSRYQPESEHEHVDLGAMFSAHRSQSQDPECHSNSIPPEAAMAPNAALSDSAIATIGPSELQGVESELPGGIQPMDSSGSLYKDWQSVDSQFRQELQHMITSPDADKQLLGQQMQLAYIEARDLILQEYMRLDSEKLQDLDSRIGDLALPPAYLEEQSKTAEAATYMRMLELLKVAVELLD